MSPRKTMHSRPLVWASYRYPGESESDARSRRAWCEAWYRDPRVMAWLVNNPVPDEWTGTATEWAYTEMPAPSGTPMGFHDKP